MSFKKILQSENVSGTKELAEQFGKQLRGGEVIQLIGDLGAGKTTFVKGLAKGLGSKDRVSSPTFTFYKIYGGGRWPLYHYDFYRMHDDLMIRNELAEFAANKKAVFVLEWAEKIQAVLPRGHIKIHIDALSDEKRKFTVTLPARSKIKL